MGAIPHRFTLRNLIMTTQTTKTPTIDATITGDTLRLVFSHGEAMTLRTGMLSAEIIQQATMHGLKQKLVDAAAISRNPDTGKSATVQDKFDAVLEVYDRLCAGQWNKNREGGGATGGLLLRALLAMHDGRKTREQIEAFLADKTDAEKAALRANPKVAAIIATLKVDKADKGIDTDALLGELA